MVNSSHDVTLLSVKVMVVLALPITLQHHHLAMVGELGVNY